MTEIHGNVSSRFDAVADVFARNFDKHGEVGASVCIYHEGEVVVDLWGGSRSDTENLPWERGTLVPFFSATKGCVAVLVNRLASDGLLDLDRPVSDYWKEYGVNGKDKTTLRWILSHQAGQPGFPDPVTLDSIASWTPIVDSLANAEPWWDPGTRHGYHPVTWGYLVGEAVFRATGWTVSQHFDHVIRKPLGLDLFVGKMPADWEPRVATVIHPEQPTAEELGSVEPLMLQSMMAMMDPTSIQHRTFVANGMAPDSGDIASPIVRASEGPASAGVGSAASLAKLYAATMYEVEGQQLWDSDTLQRAATPQATGPDEVLLIPMSYGLGFYLPTEHWPLGGPACFGHPGHGGSLGFADPAHGLAFGYVMNRLKGQYVADARWNDLVNTVYSCIGSSG